MTACSRSRGSEEMETLPSTPLGEKEQRAVRLALCIVYESGLYDVWKQPGQALTAATCLLMVAPPWRKAGCRLLGLPPAERTELYLSFCTTHTQMRPWARCRRHGDCVDPEDAPQRHCTCYGMFDCAGYAVQACAAAQIVSSCVQICASLSPAPDDMDVSHRAHMGTLHFLAKCGGNEL